MCKNLPYRYNRPYGCIANLAKWDQVYLQAVNNFAIREVGVNFAILNWLEMNRKPWARSVMHTYG